MKKSVLLFLTLLLTASVLIAQEFGNCVDLDGIDDYLLVPHHESLNPGDGDWSVAFWIRAADYDQLSPVVMKRDSDYPYTQYLYGFGKDDPHNPEPGKRIYVNHIESAGNLERSGHTTNEFIDGNWHHIAVIADRLADGIIVYVDGTQAEFNPLYYSGAWPDVSNTADLIIGCFWPPYCIEGPLDELSIWSKALGINQVQSLMNDTLSPVYYNSPDSGIVAYFRFEEYEDLGIYGGGPDDMRDMSYQNNHADTEGDPELILSGIPVGTDQFFQTHAYNLYPNPTYGRFHISNSIYPTNQKFKNDITRIEIVDLNGKAMESVNLKNGTRDLAFDLTGYPAGIYLCRIYLSDSITVKKIVKF
ncbi:MAG: LamG-like jellyroll fold domain-containing protein [Bacteroidota bacterium]